MRKTRLLVVSSALLIFAGHASAECMTNSGYCGGEVAFGTVYFPPVVNYGPVCAPATAVGAPVCEPTVFAPRVVYQGLPVAECGASPVCEPTTSLPIKTKTPTLAPLPEPKPVPADEKTFGGYYRPVASNKGSTPVKSTVTATKLKATEAAARLKNEIAFEQVGENSNQAAILDLVLDAQPGEYALVEYATSDCTPCDQTEALIRTKLALDYKGDVSFVRVHVNPLKDPKGTVRERKDVQAILEKGYPALVLMKRYASNGDWQIADTWNGVFGPKEFYDRYVAAAK